MFLQTTDMLLYHITYISEGGGVGSGAAGDHCSRLQPVNKLAYFSNS